MNVLQATLGQMLVLFSLIAMGFIVAKLKIVPNNSDAVLSKLETVLFVPALVLGTFASNLTVEKLSIAGKLFGISFIICFVMMALAVGISKCCSKDSYIRNIYTYGLAFSNFGFVGNAVVSAVFPELFLEYMIFTLPLWTMIYLWGVPCLLIPSGEGKQPLKSRLKAFCNPMFVAMLVGIIIGITGIQLPGPISQVISVTGSCMSPIAMLLTGITVAKMDLKKILSIKSIYAVSLVRLILFPVAAIGLFFLFPAQQSLVVCTICSLAMPLGLNTIVIPGGYGKDTSVAAGAALVSHLLSVITIPIIFYVMMCIL